MFTIAQFLHHHVTGISLWLAVICTFAIYSVLYKENPYYRLFEHIFIGLAAGQGVYATVAEVLKPKWWDPMVVKGQWWWALAVVAGMMFYFIYSKRNGWISRIMFGILMGLGAGMAFQDFAGMYIPQIKGSFKSVIPVNGLTWAGAINNFVFVMVLVTVMAYFFFSIDHKAKTVKYTAGLGRWFLMFAFGAVFGSTVMARMALLIGRVNFIVKDWWLPAVPIGFKIAIPIAITLLIVLISLWPKKPKKQMEELSEEPAEIEPVTEL